MEDAHMKEQGLDHAIVALTEAASRQEEVAAVQLMLTCGRHMITQSLLLFQQLETDEALADEDKVGVQLRVLQEASESLWHLHKRLSHTSRCLKAHQRDLQRLKNV
jgi:hypothetical protein